MNKKKYFGHSILNRPMVEIKKIPCKSDKVEKRVLL